MYYLKRCLVFLLVFAFVSCGPHKVCSGLNPEIGKYNTPKKIRKGRRSLHSGPEKEAYHRRAKKMKKRKSRPGKSVPVKRGIFSFRFGGSIHIGGGGGGVKVGGGGNVQAQQKN